MAIVPIGEAHVETVVRLHLQELRSDLVGASGQALLTMRYRSMVEGIGACAWVDVLDGAVAGFVGLVWDETALRAVLRRRFGSRFWLWALVQVALRPRTLGAKRAPGALPELRPIVVAPAARGSATTDRLFRAVFGGAAERGFARIESWVEDDNLASLRAHRKRGFVDQDRVGYRIRLVAEVPR